MKNLRYFLGGILSVLFILPLLNKLLELCVLFIEALKIKPSLKILNYQKDTVVLKEFLKPVRPIYDEDFEYFEEYDDED